MKQKRCYGCIKIIKDRICHHCGYDNEKQNEMHQLPIGTQLKEQYVIGKVLGQGGFGITYLGWDMPGNCPVAVKEFFPASMVMRESSKSMNVVSSSGDKGVSFQKSKERFIREAEMLARFSQVPEIVQVRDFFHANNTAYIVMEYIDGITLKEYVKQQGQPLSVDETMRWAEPVILALAKVHETGLIHRDISPDNLMLLPNGKIKVLDFGAVRDVGDAAADKPMTESTEAILKHGYAPMEQYQYHGSLGPWTDVYALCATIYFCLTKEVPMDAPERLVEEQEMDFLQRVPALSQEQAEVLQAGMRLRATERIASMQELYQRLFAEKIRQKQEQKKRRQKRLAATACTGLFLALGCFLWVRGAELADAIAKGMSSVASGDADDGQDADGAQNTGNGQTTGGAQNAGDGQGADDAQNAGDGQGTDDAQNAENGQESGDSQKAERLLSGQCGDTVTWTLQGDTLTIGGTGATWYFCELEREKEALLEKGVDEQQISMELPGWYLYRGDIKQVRVEGGVTHLNYRLLEVPNMEYLFLEEGVRYIGENAIGEISYFFQDVVFPKSLETLEVGVFWSFPEHVMFLNPETEIMVEDGESPFGSCQLASCGIYGYAGSTAEKFAKICAEENNGKTDFYTIDFIIGETMTGKCGDAVTWTLKDGILLLEGTGETWYYNQKRWHDYFIMMGVPENMIRDDIAPWNFYSGEIKEIQIGKGVTSLNERLFENLYGLEQVDLGSVEEIEAFCFENCGMKEVVIPETVKKLTGNSFNLCPNLERVEILNGAEEVDLDAFYECSSLKEIYFSKEAVPTVALVDDLDSLLAKDITFYVYEGSAAEKLAQEYGFEYVLRDTVE